MNQVKTYSVMQWVKVSIKQGQEMLELLSLLKKIVAVDVM